MAWQYLEKELSENIKRINYDLICSFAIGFLMVVLLMWLLPSNDNITIIYAEITLFIAVYFLGAWVKNSYSLLKHSIFDYVYFLSYTIGMFSFSIYLLLKSERYPSLLIIVVTGVLIVLAVIIGILVGYKRNKERKNRKGRPPFSKSHKQNRFSSVTQGIFLSFVLRYISSTFSNNQAIFIIGCGIFVSATWYFFRSISSGFNLYNELKER